MYISKYSVLLTYTPKKQTNLHHLKRVTFWRFLIILRHTFIVSESATSFSLPVWSCIRNTSLCPQVQGTYLSVIRTDEGLLHTYPYCDWYQQLLQRLLQLISCGWQQLNSRQVWAVPLSLLLTVSVEETRINFVVNISLLPYEKIRMSVWHLLFWYL